MKRSTCKSRMAIIYVSSLISFHSATANEIDVDFGVNRPVPLLPIVPPLDVSYPLPGDHDPLALQYLSEMPLHLSQ